LEAENSAWCEVQADQGRSMWKWFSTFSIFRDFWQREWKDL